MRPVLFTFCAANELFFSALYVAYFTPGFTGKWPQGLQLCARTIINLYYNYNWYVCI